MRGEKHVSKLPRAHFTTDVNTINGECGVLLREESYLPLENRAAMLRCKAQVLAVVRYIHQHIHPERGLKKK